MSASVRGLFAIALFTAAVACGGATPQVNVLGVSEKQARASQASPRTVLVFLEVVNPTKLELRLSRLEYQFNAESLFSVDGAVALSRAVQAGASAVIEVPVQLSALRAAARQGAAEPAPDGSVLYSLEGKLFALTERSERSWTVKVHGVLSPDAIVGVHRSPRVRVRIADRH